MTLNGAIAELTILHEHPMMPDIFKGAIQKIIETVSECEEPLAQPDVPGTNVGDMISRQVAIDALGNQGLITAMIVIDRLPPVHPTIYGYNIEHLELIARVLQKENLPPDRVAEALTDIGRIIDIVRCEFEEALRRVVTT